jgi:trehalose/maltose hydrolase-like predicted phosphorylase
MQVSDTSNAYQKPITLPVEPNTPKYSSGEVYEASNGNAITDENGKLSITPQGKTNLNNIQEEKATQADELTQAQKDERRGEATQVLAHQSKKSQVEIYMSVATDSDVNLENNTTSSVIETLRETQKQNQAVQAYATYQQNQAKSTLV